MGRNVILAIQDSCLRDDLAKLLRKCSANVAAITTRGECLIYEAVRRPYAYALLALPSLEEMLSIVRVIRAASPHTRSIVFAHGAAEDYRSRCLEAGAYAVLNSQSSATASLQSELHRIIGENKPFTDEIALSHSTPGGAPEWTEEDLQRLMLPLRCLSRREKHIYCLVLRGLEKSDVSGYLKATIRTVDRHYRNIQRKLWFAGIPAQDVPQVFRLVSSEWIH